VTGLVYVQSREDERIQKLAQNAQWFEGPHAVVSKYRKQGVQGITAIAIDVVIETAIPTRPRPSASTCPTIRAIREEYGSKSVSLSNINEAYDKSTLSGVPQRVFLDAGGDGRARSGGTPLPASSRRTCTR